MASPSSSATPSGGLKGFFQRAGKSFEKAFGVSKEWSWWLAQKGGTVGLFLASTSMVVLMPLIFEINREVMVCIACTLYKVSSVKIFLPLYQPEVDRTVHMTYAWPEQFDLSLPQLRIGSKFWHSEFTHTSSSCFLSSSFLIVSLALTICLSLTVQTISSERLQVAELRNQGHSDRQLQEMGFSEVSLHSPAVASMKK